jgi:hypothetical protein
MKRIAILAVLSLCAFNLIHGQGRDRESLDPEVTEVWKLVDKVIPAETIGMPPSDAVVLFDGSDLDAWMHLDGSDAKWEVADGAFTVKKETGDIKTRETFGDVQLHIEWMAPTDVVGSGQNQGNSGIFLQERYEIQVLDSYTTETYANGQAGAIYKQHPPLANANRPPLTWQAYDIIYRAPVFNDEGKVLVPARITAFLNGILVQDNTSIWGPTEYKGLPVYVEHGNAALKLQDHGNPVKFRNIWVREL